MSSTVQYEPLSVKQALNKVTAPSMPFSWSLNPYRGCQHGCSFCYARSTHSFLGLESDDTFQKHILMKLNAPEALEKQLRQAIRSRSGTGKLGKVAIGTATDPYQPVEAKAMLTRQCLELFARYRIPVSITTRSPLVLRDIDLLRSIPDASVNFSVSTLDFSVWRSFEPFTPSPVQRLKAVRTLNETGVRCGIFTAPMLPLLTDGEEQLRQLFAAAAEHKADFVMASYLRLSTREVKVWFFQGLRDKYPELVSAYADWYNRSSSLPETYRQEGYAKVRALLQEYGLNASERDSAATQMQKAAPEERHHQPVQLAFTFD